ncbi:MAG: poly(3-hydroxybutyrate) depolymerase [Phycisphaerales bacterium]|jgi:poly(3-hydroxybutyrate) depolymerase
MPRYSRLFASLSAALALLLAAMPALARQDAEPAGTPLPSIDSLLVLEKVGKSQRSPIVTDAVEYQLATGEWAPPQEGDTVTAPDGETKAWRTITPNDKGNFRDDALAGGWAFATVTLDEPRTLLLRARGHRHVLVNGEPRVGDIYSLGITTVPVRLHAGENTLLFKGGRGSIRAEFIEPPAAVFLETRDATLPTLLLGDTSLQSLGVFVTNATEDWVSGLRVATVNPGNAGVEFTVESPIDPLPPFSSRKVHVQAPPLISLDPETRDTTVRLTLLSNDVQAGEPIEFKLQVRGPNEKHSRTFVSTIDGSVQYYAVTPPPEATLQTPADPQAFVLTLHGASVQARGQAGSYAPKEGVYIVAPTNRRPFGFDWEDWGRLDAMEVLDLASGQFNADPARTYLTGHSMGGHGTWINGAYFAPRFAAIAPSAGWRDFWSYGGGGTFDTETEITEILDRAANASRTLLMKDNYASTGVYILHGDADDNVPVDQARFMREQLAGFHPNFAYYEQPGAGHWWGNRCVDWPAMFEFFARNTTDPAPSRIDFTTVDPGISATSGWVTIERQIRAREPSRVVAEYDAKKNTVVITDTNVGALTLRLSELAALKPEDTSEPLTVTFKGREFPVEGDTVCLAMDLVGRMAKPAPDPARKNHLRAGPFKDAWRHNVLFVIGTRGTDEQNAWALAKARYDAETFWYRGNGSIEIIRDTDFDPTAEPDRGVVVYGNSKTNAAWSVLLPEPPIEVFAGRATIWIARTGTVDLLGIHDPTLACVFAMPRPGSKTAMVAAVGGTGIVGMRTTNQFPYFVSGAHYPDWFIADPRLYLEAEAGVVGAGFFGADWGLGGDWQTNLEGKSVTQP